MRVAVLHDAAAPGGRLDEQDGMVQVAFVEDALRRLGHETARVAVSLDLESARARLQAFAPDVAFNLVESVAGHGRLIHLAPGLLESMRIPFTGSPSTPVFVTTHKTLAKRLLRGAGLPTPDWIEAGASPAWPRACAGSRVIFKPVWEDASVGIDDDSVTSGMSVGDIQRRLEASAGELERFAEIFVEGREFNVSVLEVEGEPVVLPAAEMAFDGYPPSRPRIVGYRAKWEPGSFEYTHTLRLFDLPPADASLLARMEALCRTCWRLFGLRGYARVDFRVDDVGTPLIIEVNANPCLSPDAGFAAAAERAGINGVETVDRLVRAALLHNHGAEHVPHTTHIR